MADYIDGEYIANFPKVESMSDDDILIVEDSEATKQATYAQIKESIGSIKNITPYFGVAGSPDFYPSHDGSTASILGSGTLGTMILGDSGTWEKEIPEMAEYDYLWVSLFIEYSDGTSEWLTPIRLTDEIEKEDIKSLIEEVAAAQLAIENSAKKIQDNADQISDINKSLEESGTAISDIEDRLTAAESGVEENKSSISSLTTRVGNAESGISENKTAISNLEIRVASAESGISDNAKAISNLTTQLNTTNSNVSDNAKSISDLETRVAKTESDISDITKKIEDIDSNITDIKEDIESLMKLIGNTNISDIGDGTITGAIESVKYAIVAPDEEGDN